MNKNILFFILFVLLPVLNLNAQNINITKLKESGRDSIVKQAFIKLKEKKITASPNKHDKIRVMANSKEVYILYNMGFLWNGEEKQFENFDLKVSFTESECSISPIDFDQNSNIYKLNVNQKNVIKLCMNNQTCSFEEDERIQIKEEKDYYVMTVSRGIAKGAECYHINKKTGEKSMIWHETPEPNYRDNNFIKDEDKFIEII
jgi:hypothetical protein